MAAPAPRTGKGGASYTAAVQHAIADRNLCSPTPGSPDSDLEASCESSSDTYSDPDTDPDTDIEPGTGINSDCGPHVESDAESDAELDSEAEEILEDIAQLGKEGPAKPNHTPHTQKLWKREGEFWKG